MLGSHRSGGPVHRIGAGATIEGTVRFSGRLEIEGLSADETLGTDGVRQERGHSRRDGRLVAARQVTEREVEQSEGGENRDRLAELEMVRLPPASQRRVVHRRQVVETTAPVGSASSPRITAQAMTRSVASPPPWWTCRS